MKVGKYPDPWMSPKVEIRNSPIHGMGMFAIADISEGERVVVWSGECYTDGKGAAKARSDGKGTMQWDDDVFSIETGIMEDIFRINHSCDPNVWMSGPFTVVARRDISIGEEILIDYAVMLHSESSYSIMECSCGSFICRGRITDEDWKNPILQERYKDHFTPWLNKKIADLQVID